RASESQKATRRRSASNAKSPEDSRSRSTTCSIVGRISGARSTPTPRDSPQASAISPSTCFRAISTTLVIRPPASGPLPRPKTPVARLSTWTQTRSEPTPEGEKRFFIIGWNNPTTANNSIGRAGALAALRNLRPNPAVTQIEELQSRGNSYYHGVSFEAQRRL